ncbi:Plastid-lipid-associated protein 6, chloroplastic [Ancistrocladus abbreviatus]
MAFVSLSSISPSRFSAAIVHPPCSSGSSSSSSFAYLIPRKFRSISGAIYLQSLKWNTNSNRRRVVPIFAVDQVSVLDPPPPSPSPRDSAAELVASLKLKLLGAVSGLNRGLAANEDDLRLADDTAKQLEAAGGPIDLSVGVDKLQGRWKLIYSSAFSSRTLGGSRPGPPTGRLLPITLGQVFQRIDTVSKDFDNIVELELGAPWPLPPIEVTATLAHKFELIEPAKIKITFEKTSVKTRGNLSQLPPLEIPRIPDALRPPSNRRSGEFEVTYIDPDTRITRGDRGELRVFVIS